MYGYDVEDEIQSNWRYVINLDKYHPQMSSASEQVYV